MKLQERSLGSSTWGLAMGGIGIHFIIYEYYVWKRVAVVKRRYQVYHPVEGYRRKG
jgi:hypothetical protein